MLEILFQVIWFLIKLPFYILYYLGLGIWLLVEWIIENSSSNKKIVSSIGTLTEEETLNKLTPLIISKDLINYFQIGDESVTIKDLKNNNGILNYKCQESSNSKKMTITLYKEGVAIAFRRKCYFTPFDSNTNCVVYKKYKEVELDHFDPISFMKKVVDSDYFYSDNEGHIFAKITNDSNEDKVLSLEKGAGFMQGIFLEYGITVDDDADGVRNGGFGSTSK